MSGLSLLAPIGLIALIGLPLIVLFHMRNPTPVSREVPTLRFWRLAMREESQSERFRRPPVSLLFLLHLLLVALIAFALARPATSRALGGFGARFEPRHVIILLDGSTSMSAIGPPGATTRFETARTVASKRFSDHQEGDVATLVLMGTHTSTYEATDSAGLKALTDQLRDMKLPGGRADLNAALKLSSDLLLPSMSDEVVVISDGALSADPSLVSKVNAPIEFIDVGGGVTDNVAITDVATRSSVSRPGQQQLYVRIVNFGVSAVTTPLVITADGIEVSRSDVTIEAGGKSEEIVQDLPVGATSVSIALDASDVLPADNSAASLLVQGAEFGLRVLLVSDTPTSLLRALSVLPGSRVTLMSPIDAATQPPGNEYDLIVYEHTTPATQVPDAPLLLVNPPADGLLPTNGVMSNPTIQRVRAQDPILNGVELSGVTIGQTPVFKLDATAVEIVGAEAGPLLYRTVSSTTGQPIVVLAFDVAQSNLTQRVAFPILIANIAAELSPSPLPPAAVLGEPLVYRPGAAASSVVITLPNGEATEVEFGTVSAGGGSDSLREFAFGDTGQPGVYGVAEFDGNGVALGRGSFVVNAGHAEESDLTPNRDLRLVLAEAHSSGDTGAASGLSDFWPAIVAAAFAILLLEWGLTLSRRPQRRRRFAHSESVDR